MLPYPLVVGAGNSNDQGPAWPCKRPSGGQGGGGGLIKGEIGPPPPSNASLTPPGLTGKDLKRWQVLEEVDRCPANNHVELPWGQRVVDYRSRRCVQRTRTAADTAPKAPSRTDGGASAMWI
jgi:hypothetical protein